MKQCYEKFFQSLLIQKIQEAIPEFKFMDESARRKTGKLKFYGPGRLTGFMWNPCDNLKFILVFRVPINSDSFEASAEWTEFGKTTKEQTLLYDELYTDTTFQLTNASALVQSLSLANGDSGADRVTNWEFWKPSVDLSDKIAFMNECISEELREVDDIEAYQRVDAAIENAIYDIKRCVLPWFLKKYNYYLTTCKEHKLNG